MKTGHLKRQIKKFRALAAERMLDTAVGGRAGPLDNQTVAMLVKGMMRNATPEKSIWATAASSDSNAAQIAAMRKAYFADVDAMEASGEVVLPQ